MVEHPPMASAVGWAVEGSIPSPDTRGFSLAAKASGVMTPKIAGSSPASPAKLYAVVRSGLPPGAKACQAAHALRAFQDAYPEIESRWWAESNTLVMLETDQLEALEAEAHAKGIPCVRFVEPDWAPEGTLTALVLGPDAKRIVNRLPLAYAPA